MMATNFMWFLPAEIHPDQGTVVLCHPTRGRLPAARDIELAVRSSLDLTPGRKSIQKD